MFKVCLFHSLLSFTILFRFLYIPSILISSSYLSSILLSISLSRYIFSTINSCLYLFLHLFLWTGSFFFFILNISPASLSYHLTFRRSFCLSPFLSISFLFQFHNTLPSILIFSSLLPIVLFIYLLSVYISFLFRYHNTLFFSFCSPQHLFYPPSFSLPLYHAIFPTSSPSSTALQLSR